MWLTCFTFIKLEGFKWPSCTVLGTLAGISTFGPALCFQKGRAALHPYLAMTSTRDRRKLALSLPMTQQQRWTWTICPWAIKALLYIISCIQNSSFSSLFLPDFQFKKVSNALFPWVQQPTVSPSKSFNFFSSRESREFFHMNFHCISSCKCSVRKL